MSAPRAAGLLAAAALAGCYTWPHLRQSGLPDTEYYTDLGPSEIDVSAYPPRYREDYKTFQRVCSQCHTLARAVNSPTRSRAYWRFHLARMSAHSRMRHQGPLDEEDLHAVLDFLEYDAKVRKTTPEFRRQDEELKRRFDPILERQLEILYRGG